MQDSILLSYSYEDLAAELENLGFPAYRTGQIFAWLHQKNAMAFDEMTNLSLADRAKLTRQFQVAACAVLQKQVSALDGTTKFLFGLRDGEAIESVLMHYSYGNSLCLSTQVGCKMHCAFCQSGQQGWRRNLSASEMLGQIYTAERESGESIAHIVLMGIGEPLDNYDNVLRFIRLLCDPRGRNFSVRRISLSTCGLVPQIQRLQTENLGVTLSVSLHAPNNELRSKLMSVNNKWNLETLIPTCKRYADVTSRRISYEYALFRGVNDSTALAEELASLLRGSLAHVNLIPANENPLLGYAPSAPQTVRRFAESLQKRGVNATVRRSLGRDILAACGQLRQTQLNQ